MANLDRGAYDQEQLHDFDADEMNDDGEKSRLPLLVLIALVVLAAFGGVVWLAYTQGVERGRADAPRIIVAQSHPTPPQAEAASPYGGLNIYQPVTPPSKTENTDTLPPPPTPLAASHPASAPPALRPSAAATQQASTAIPAASPAKPAATQQGQASQAPAPVKPATVQSSAPSRQSGGPAQGNAGAPAAITGTGVLLQIGSYKSDSEAMHSWNAFKARHSIAAGYRPDIQKVDLGAKGIWYRLRLGALPDKRAAIELCEQLKTQGASCLIAR